MNGRSRINVVLLVVAIGGTIAAILIVWAILYAIYLITYGFVR